MDNADFERLDQILDRRFEQFEKTIEAKMEGVGTGITSINTSVAAFINQVGNMHKDYKPRFETDKDEREQDDRLNRVDKRLTTDVEELQVEMQRMQKRIYTATGAVVVLSFLIGIAAHAMPHIP